MLMLFQCLLQGVFVLWLVSSMRQGLTLAVLLQSPVAWVLLFVFSLYWPLGLGLMAVNSSRGAFWSFGQGFRIMIHALPEFFVTTVLVSLVYLVPWILFMFTVVATAGLALLATPLLVGLPLAYSHGVAGALLAHLFRTHPDLLE